MFSLLSRSWLLMVRKKRTIFSGIAAVALVGVLLQVVMEQRVGAEVMTQIQHLLGDQRYAQISAQMQLAGNETDTQALIQSVTDEVAQKIDTLTPAEQSTFISGMIAQSMPAILLVFFLLLVYLLVSVWVRGFFLHVALLPAGDFRETVARSTGSFLRFLGSLVATLLASGSWLPFLISPLLATPLYSLFFLSLLLPLFLAPRLALSPVLVLGGAKIWKSVGESFRSTRGHYWKILITMFLAALFSGIVAGLVSGLLSAIVTLNYPSVVLLLAWIRQMLALAAGAFVSVTLVHLSREVLGIKA